MTEAAGRVSYTDVAGTCIARAYVAALTMEHAERMLGQAAERIRETIKQLQRGETRGLTAQLYSALVLIEDAIHDLKRERELLEETANTA